MSLKYQAGGERAAGSFSFPFFFSFPCIFWFEDSVTCAVNWLLHLFAGQQLAFLSPSLVPRPWPAAKTSRKGVLLRDPLAVSGTYLWACVVWRRRQHLEYSKTAKPLLISSKGRTLVFSVVGSNPYFMEHEMLHLQSGTTSKVLPGVVA